MGHLMHPFPGEALCWPIGQASQLVLNAFEVAAEGHGSHTAEFSRQENQPAEHKAHDPSKIY
jgi:hypothetical protein